MGTYALQIVFLIKKTNHSSLIFAPQLMQQREQANNVAGRNEYLRMDVTRRTL